MKTPIGGNLPHGYDQWRVSLEKRNNLSEKHRFSPTSIIIYVRYEPT